ncbi:MAG: WavE lipopolysaccharide synthesis family protein [Alphaproteobacteria bacterium]|nr:WavE lipopolysaccharide synthesis family protein [Alphaproteobacteria bacterium]
MKKKLIKWMAFIKFPFNKKERKRFRDKHLRKLRSSEVYFEKENSFYTFDKKPLYSQEYKALSEPFNEREKIAIVLQGPLKKEWDFTLETLKIYRKNFAGCSLIVSTWDTEDKKLCEALEKLGAFVITGPAPGENFLNMHHQIVSSQRGLQKAKELGCTYALKTRTDQRIYETNVPEYLLNILNLFPLKSKVEGQKQRLITTSFNTFKYRLYEISDMFLFGDIDDVLNFWSCPLAQITDVHPKNLMAFLKNRPSEIYYMTNFLERTGWPIDWTLGDSWKAFGERFCIIDTPSVGLYWPKYSAEVSRFRNFFGQKNILEELTFKEWLDLYLKDGEKPFIPEYYVENAAISTDDLVLKEDKACIKLSNKNQHLLEQFDLSAYKIEASLSEKMAFVLTDDETTSLEEVETILRKKSPVLYLAQKESSELLALQKTYSNLIPLTHKKVFKEELSGLRFFPLKKGV